MASLDEIDYGSDLDYALVEVLDDSGAAGAWGQTVDWLPEEEQYLVKTFDGELISVPPASLHEFHPGPAEEEDGGFDAAFPASQPRSDIFTSEICDVLAHKHYCVVQMSSRPSDRQAAVNEAQDGAAWLRLNPDFETDFTGRTPNGKKLQWASDDPPADGSESGIYTAVETLNCMGAAIVPIAESLGFMGGEMSNVLMTMKCEQAEEEALLQDLEEDANKVIDGRDVRDLLAFVGRRKICMMYFVSGGGGTLTFHPQGSNGVDVEVPCKENQMVVFQHGLLDFTFTPHGNQLVLQSWILRDKFVRESGCLEMAVPEEISNVCDRIPEGPLYRNCEETSDIMSFGIMAPGSVCCPEHYHGLLGSGADGIIYIPTMRWDHTMYYSDSDQPEPGKAYCKHMAFQDNEQVTLFDPDFFGMTDQESMFLDPPSRNVLQTGYEALFRGGWTKRELKGQVMSNVIAHVECDYANLVNRGLMGVFSNTRQMVMAGGIASRLHYCLGTTGPATTIDTACSAGLTAVCLTHAWMRPRSFDSLNASTRTQIKRGLAMSANGIFDPFATIAMCGSSMMTHMGRCFTFDQSGDGFVRAEGQAALYIKQSAREDFSRLNMLCGTCMNQDGRSASMTAPHGPSQQECIRASLKEGAITAAEIQIQEMHGTGTALGDPIEVGALRATMMIINGVVRDRGLVKTSSKSNIGHTELSAGMCGILKCVILGINAVAAPNVHLRLLNPHIDSKGYPVYFTSELVDQGNSTAYNGVSSFGVGGSNARGDVWGRAINGPRNTNPPEFGYDLTRSRIQKFADVFGLLEHTTHDLAALGAAGGLMQYDGEFLIGSPFSSDAEFFLEGSFNGWGKGQKMTYNEENGTCSTAITLGDTRVEHFRINVNGYADAKIFPTQRGSLQPQSKILGPGVAPPGHYWVIDGREDGASQGTVYNVVFCYDMQTRQKRIYWEPTIDEEALRNAAMSAFHHRYFVVGSWNVFDPKEMQAVIGSEPGLFTVTLRIGNSGHEEFNFLRDGKADEIIYPAHHRALSGDVPVRGPDGHGKGKYFGIIGDTGTSVMIQLQVWDGEITVTTDSSEKGMMTFRSIPGNEGKAYFVVGEWNGGTPIPMFLKPRENIWTKTIRMPNFNASTRKGFPFHIVVDEDEKQAIHPEMPRADLFTSCAVGPDADGAGLEWSIVAEPGSSVVITLDMSQTDKRLAVHWAEISGATATPVD